MKDENALGAILQICAAVFILAGVIAAGYVWLVLAHPVLAILVGIAAIVSWKYYKREKGNGDNNEKS